MSVRGRGRVRSAKGIDGRLRRLLHLGERAKPIVDD